jgi:hypothetical protein
MASSKVEEVTGLVKILDRVTPRACASADRFITTKSCHHDHSAYEFGSPCRRCAVSRPSITGIFQSIRTTSYGLRLADHDSAICRKASTPSRATSTSRPNVFAIAGEDLTRTAALSSTTRHAHTQQFVGPEHAPCPAGWSARQSGHEKWKLEPLPASDSTQILPSISSTRFLLMAKPQPGAAVLAGGRRIGLAEALEHLAALLRMSCRCRCLAPRNTVRAAGIFCQLSQCRPQFHRSR